jgi:hypothetical protein
MPGLALGVVAAAVALMTAAQGAPSASSRGGDPSSPPPLVSKGVAAELVSSPETKPVAPRSDVRMFGRRIQLPRTEPVDPSPAPDVPTCRMPMMPADPSIDPKFVMGGPPPPGIVHHLRSMRAPLPCAGPGAGSTDR